MSALTPENAAHRLNHWLSASPGGLALLEYSDGRTLGATLDLITGLRRLTVTGGDETVDTMQLALRESQNRPLCVLGFESTLPQSRWPELLTRLNAARDAIVPKHVHQIWCVTPFFARMLTSDARDLDSWVSVRVAVTPSPSPIPLRNHAAVMSYEDAKAVVDRAAESGAHSLEIQRDRIQPILDNWKEQGLTEWVAKLTRYADEALFVSRRKSLRPTRVFLSYSQSSQEFKEQVYELANRLRTDGVNAILDQAAEPYQGWAAWCEEQIDWADYIVIICNERYFLSSQNSPSSPSGRGVAYEFDRIRIKLYGDPAFGARLLPVVFQESDIEFIPTQIRQLTHYRLPDAYANLLAKIEGNQQHRLEPIRMRPSINRIWQVPIRRIQPFCGGITQLENLHTGLNESHKLAICGIGGIGKTQLAVEYAYQHQAAFDHVLWLNGADIAGGVASTCTLLGFEPNRRDLLHHWLETHDNWLLIIDDVTDRTTLEGLLPSPPNGRVLLTAKSRALLAGFKDSVWELSTPSEDQAAGFLMERTGQHEDPEAARELARSLGCLPLALQLVAGHIKKARSTFTRYLQSFRTRGLDVLGAESNQIRTIIIEAVQQLSPAARDVIHFFSLLAPSPIPDEFLTRGGWYLSKDVASRLADVGNDPLKLDELLAELEACSLVRSNRLEQTVTLHPLVPEVLLRSLENQARENLYRKALVALEASISKEAHPTVAEIDRRLPHLQRLIDHADTSEVGSVFLVIMRITANSLELRLRFAEAEALYRRRIALIQSQNREFDEDAWKSWNDLGMLLLRTNGRASEAKMLYADLIARTEQAFGPRHPKLAPCFDGMGNAEAQLGHAKESDEWSLKARTIDPNPVVKVNNITGRLAKPDLTDEELAQLEIEAKGLPEEFAAFYGPTHPDIGMTHMQLGHVLRRAGKYADAERELETAKRLVSAYYIDGHPNLVNIWRQLAALYGDTERHEQAKAAMLKAAEIEARIANRSSAHYPNP